VTFALLFANLLRLFFPLDELLLLFLQLPNLVFFLFLIFQQLILHFIVIPEEKHLAIDQTLQCVRLEAHIYQKNEVIEKFVIVGR